jgi:hypothetical protein
MGVGDQWKRCARLGTPGYENAIDYGLGREYYGYVEETRVVFPTGMPVMETGLADV